LKKRDRDLWVVVVVDRGLACEVHAYGSARSASRGAKRLRAGVNPDYGDVAVFCLHRDDRGELGGPGVTVT
jgi:hypothetical protein